MDSEEPDGGAADRDANQQPDKSTSTTSGRGIEPMQTHDKNPPAAPEPTNDQQPTRGLFHRTKQGFVGWLRHPLRERPKWTDVTTVIFSAAIVFFACMQWVEMHGTSKQTDALIGAANKIEGHQKQIVADNKQALADNKAAIEKTLKENRDELAKMLAQNQDALKANLTQGQSSLDASMNAMRLDQRAWVGIRAVDFHLTSDSPLAANVRFVNTGKTPALNMRTVLNFQWVTTQESLTPLNPAQAVPYRVNSISTMNPAQEAVTPIQSTGPLEPTIFKSISDGRMRLYLRVRVTYDDIFARPRKGVGAHQTEQCWVYIPIESGWQDCDFGNYAN
jgi:hypothetical protein